MKHETGGMVVVCALPDLGLEECVDGRTIIVECSQITCTQLFLDHLEAHLLGLNATRGLMFAIGLNVVVIAFPPFGDPPRDRIDPGLAGRFLEGSSRLKIQAGRVGVGYGLV